MSNDDLGVVNSTVEDYLDSMLPESPSPAREMEAEAERRGFPIVGPGVGRLFMLLMKFLTPTRLVELGSGFGYSAYWFGKGSPRTEIHLTDYDEENLERARTYLAQTDHPNRFRYHVGDALESVESITGPVNCVLIDLDKTSYLDALDWAEERLAPGGWLIADNVLWKGQVADPSVSDDATESIRSFNQRLYEDEWDSTIIPIRDGVALAQRRH